MSRQVKRVRKDDDGDIVALCGDGWTVDRTTAIVQIAADPTAYYVQEQAPPVFVVVRERRGRKYLKTEADLTPKNNLDELPPCPPTPLTRARLKLAAERLKARK